MSAQAAASPELPSGAAAESSLRRPAGEVFSTIIGPFLGLLAVFLLFWAADQVWGAGHFASLQNARLVLVQSATVGMAALGMTMIIIAGGIDLSAGTTLALCATVLAWLLKSDCGPGVSIAGALAAGCLAGMINGVLISALRVVPFIVTLGTMTIYLGLAKIIGKNTTVRPDPDQVPPWLEELLSAHPKPEWLLVGPGVWLLLVLAIVVAAVMRYTVFGRHVQAVGSSEATARLCGISVPFTRIAVYTLAGLFVGIAGVFQFSRLATGNPTSGAGKELLIIAAVVIGGGSLSGGRGSVVGTLTGAVIMQMIYAGCTALNLQNSIQEIIIGAIIVAAVTLDQIRQRRLLQ